MPRKFDFITAIVLAGGKSSRFGKDKAFIKVKGTVIFKRQLNVLKKIFDEIIVVANNPQKFYLLGSYIRKINERNLRAGYKLKKIEIVKDILPAKGPLCGILSGLIKSHSFYNFVVACDMPFLNEQLIRHMIKKKDGFDVVIPRIYRKFQPLFGVYSKRCIPGIKKLIKSDKLRIRSIFPALKCNFIYKKEIEKFDKSLLSLANINTEDDLKAYNKMKIPR